MIELRYRPVNRAFAAASIEEGGPVANLTLGFLGSLQIAVAGAPISTFESDKSRALLAYLAVESRQAHRRDALVGLLWPECPEETARRNLRQTLYNLRGAIGDHAADPPYLLISRDEIQFNRNSDHTLDVADFDARLTAAEAHSHPASEACDICAPLLKKAAALYRGKFLQEFFLQDSAEFEEWALVQRESLHRRAVQALVRLANYHEQRGEYEQARVFALRQIELEPWSEEAHRQVMRLLVAAGQRSGALAQYETCRRILAKELGVEPSTETRELYDQIRRGEVSAPRPAAPSAPSWSPPPLPLAPTPFLGREKELEELARLLLAPECRLLTLVGPGGIGKTRLALEAATNLRERFRDGAAFVSLAGVENPAFIIATLADAIGFTFSGPADNTTQLLNHLRDKQMILVLDNVEHLLSADQPAESSAGVLSEILERAPGVKLLVTSRELLDLQQEWLFQVGGLQLPDAETGDEVERSSAAALFLQRARRAQVGFQLEPNDRPALARICNLVGGIPLGLELAAAWVRTLSLDEIQHEIERSLDFLETSMRDLPERHRSMRAVFDHSWLLLSEEERLVLRRLSVFRGGFRREAAEQIAGATLSLLSTLQSKSLLRRVPGGRYDLHELVLQYADAKLAESPAELKATRERHSRYYLDFVQAREKHLKGARQLEALKEMSEESGNLRPAWRHAIQFGWASAIGRQLEAFWLYYEMRGGLREAKVLLGKAADALQQRCAEDGACDENWEITLESVRAQEAWFCIKLGEVEEARELLGPSVARLEALGAFKELVRPVHYTWALNLVVGDLVTARNLALRQLDMAANLGDRWEVAFAQATLARTETLLGEYPDALERLANATLTARSLGDPGMIALLLCYLGGVQIELSMFAEAKESLQESASIALTLNDRWSHAKSVAYMGVLAHMQGDREDAIRLLRTSLQHFEEMGARHDSATALNDLGRAILDLGTDIDAKQAFAAALRVASECSFTPEALAALLGLAQCQMSKGDLQQSLGVFVYVSEHPASAPMIRERARGLRDQVENRLAGDQVAAALASARGVSFEELMQRALLQCA